MDITPLPPPTNYDTLVLSGGSVNGISLIGALQYVKDNNLLNEVTTYVGTSVGALICYLLVIGYTPIEIIVYICTSQLLEKMRCFNLVAMLNGQGASSYACIQETLEKMTIDKIGRFLTLKDVQTQLGKKFICVTYNITKKEAEILGPDTHPDMPCITALRMTTNLPLIFEPYKYMNNFYIDGGISNNFPIDIADKEGLKILGIHLSYHDDEGDDVLKKDNNLIEYVYKLMLVPIEQSIKSRIKSASSKCTIVELSCKNMPKIFNFNIDSKTKLEMFSEGYEEAKKILF